MSKNKKIDLLGAKIISEIKKQCESETIDDSLRNDMKSIVAYSKLIIIIRVLNEGWQPNWEDSNEQKWFPYFNVRGGFRFLGTDYYCVNTYSSVGSRLCFKTRALAEYAGEQFVEIYKDYLLMN